MPRVAQPFELKFWPKVTRRGDDDCWDWTGARTDLGYGRFRVGRENRYAHRVAYEHLVGPIPDGLVIDHLCENTSCVNPAHLEPVTHAENIRRSADCWAS